MNFNFSGMFGGGFTNNLNKNNFDFSAFAPKQEEKVTDPIDIVSNNTPEAKVEVLEGAADVVVTKQPEVKYSPAVTNAIVPTTPDLTAAPADPITDAIQSVQPKPIDLGMDFGVKLAPEQQQEFTSNLDTLSNVQGSQGFGSGAGFMDVVKYGDAADIYKMSTLEAPNVTAYNNMVSSAINDNILYDKEEVNSKLEEIDSAGGKLAYLNSLISTDTYKNWKDTQTKEFWETNSITEVPDIGFGVLSTGSARGVPTEVGGDLGILTGLEELQGGAIRVGDGLFIKFNRTDNKFELVNEVSDLEVTGKIAASIALSMATAGAGSALSAGLGISSTAGAALASGAVAAAQGGNLEEIATSALTAGFAEHVETLQVAAEAVDATQEAIAIADTMQSIKTGVDIIKAVDSGDVLGAISSTLDLTGNGSPASYIKEALGTSDAQTAGILKVIDKQLQGESLEDSVKSGAATWVKEGGIKEIDLDIDFGNGDWETPEAIKAIGDKLVEGASWANENFIKPVVETVETLGQGAIEAASQANQFVQREIIDEVQEYMSEQNETFQAAIEPIKEDFSKLNQSVRTDLANFDKEYLQPVKEEISTINENVRTQLALFDDENLQPIKKDIEDVITKVDTTLSAFNQDYIKPIDEKLSQTNKDVRDQLANFDKDYLQPIKQDLSDTNKAFQQDIDNIQQALSETNQDFREGLSGFEDDYLNPIKDDIETMAGNLKDGLSDTNKYVREQLAGFDDNVLQPIKEEIEGVLDSIDGLDVDMSGVQDMLSGLWDAVTGLNTGLAATQEKFGQPSADKSALVKMRTQYGEQYQFEDLRNNPLLNNELFS